MTPCRICERDAGKDRFCCATCVTSAKVNLGHIAVLAHHLDGKRARRRSNWSSGTIGHAAALPLPYDPRVTAVADPIRRSLAQAGSYGANRPPEDTITGAALWLVMRCDWFAGQAFGPDLFAAFERHNDALVALFDNPPARLYLGHCRSVGPSGGCAAALYVTADDDGNPEAASVTCPACGALHWVATRQKELAAGVADYLGTSHEISNLLRHMLGADVSAAAIRGYAFRGTITTMGTRLVETRAGARDANLFRIGDVQDAAEATAAKRDLYHSARR